VSREVNGVDSRNRPIASRRSGAPASLSLSRRRFLAAAAGLGTLTLAGCGDEDGATVPSARIDAMDSVS